VLMGVAFPAHSAIVNVGALQLNPDSSWQRGGAQQEGEDDAVQLSWAIPSGIALQLLVPRSPPLIKSDEAHFYQNLTRKWSAQFGKAADIHWIQFNQPGQSGLRWLACRHPARSDDGVVFHLVTVHEGHAYSLLLFTPPGTERLPPAALALMAGANFGTLHSGWRRTASLTVIPQGEALDGLIRTEAEALADQGMLTGFGLEAEPIDKVAKTAQGAQEAEILHMAWFFDGFRWREENGRDVQQSFDIRGRLKVEAPGGTSQGPLNFVLDMATAEGPLEVRADLMSYCGPVEPWETAWSALGLNAMNVLSLLETAHACEQAPKEGKGWVMQAMPGQTVRGKLELPAVFPADRLWVEIQLVPAAGYVGAGLLQHSRMYVVFEPER